MTNLRPQAWGTTVFCDDIRAEIGGKITLVGIYSSDLVVHGPFPYTMPKFAFWINYFETPGAMTGDGKFFISLPGDEKPSIESDIPLERLRSERNKPGAEPETDSVHRLLVPIVLAPLILKEPGWILVRLHVRDIVVRLGALLVKAAPVGTTGSVGNQQST